MHAYFNETRKHNGFVYALLRRLDVDVAYDVYETPCDASDIDGECASTYDSTYDNACTSACPCASNKDPDDKLRNFALFVYNSNDAVRAHIGQ